MPASAPPAHVLIVDDDEGLLRLLEKTLHREGYATTTKQSGHGALDWLAKHQPDLMLLDLKLRDMDGKELIRRLAEQAKPVPFIVITGQGDERAAVEMMKGGALDYAVKGTQFLESLPAMVKRALLQLDNARKLEQAIAERRRLERELLEINDSEMSRLGRDLHDGLGQQLTALEMFNAGLTVALKQQAPKLADAHQELGRKLRDIVHQVRLLSHGLSPISLENQGLMNALTELADGTRAFTKVDCDFQCDPPVLIGDATVATHLFRIAQEAVNNAVKHSHARKISLALNRARQRIALEVSDNGRGFDPLLVDRNGMGLRVMQYRASLIGAQFAIASTPGKGTIVTCHLTAIT